MFDSITLSYTYNFLLYLKNKYNFDLFNIKLLYKSNEGFQYSLYPTIESFEKINNLFNIPDEYFNDFFKYGENINNIKYLNAIQFFDRFCISQYYPIIDSIKIENKNLPFYNAYILNNIYNKINVSEEILWNHYKNKFYENEIIRYKSLILNEFNKIYKNKWNLLRKYRDNKYVNFCYVDIDYVD